MMNMSDEGTPLAWGDESIRQRANPPMYLVCATTFGVGSEQGLLELERAKPKGASKLHWHDMTIREQTRSIETIASIPQWSTIAMAMPLDLARLERGRRKCLEFLLPRLESKGIRQLNLESRWRQEDRSDIQLVDALRGRRLIEDIRVEHCSSCSDDPRLWVPDQILGAIGDILCGTGDPNRWTESWTKIDERLELHIVAP